MQTRLMPRVVVGLMVGVVPVWAARAEDPPSANATASAATPAQGQAIAIQVQGAVAQARAQAEAAGQHSKDVVDQAHRVQNDAQVQYRLFLDQGSATGLSLAEVSDVIRAQVNLPDKQGVVVSRVRKESPADKAGFQDRDILLSVDGTPTADPQQATKLVDQHRDKPVEINVVRKGQRISFEYTGPPEVKVERLTRAARAVNTGRDGEYWIGVPVTPVDATLRSHLSNLPEGAGLIVNDVAADSPAKKAGLLKNDILVSVDSVKLASQNALMARVRESNGRSMLFEVIRGGGMQRLPITPEKHKAGEAIPGQSRWTIRTFPSGNVAETLEGNTFVFGQQTPPVPPQMNTVLDRIQDLRKLDEATIKTVETRLKEIESKLDALSQALKKTDQ